MVERATGIEETARAIVDGRLCELSDALQRSRIHFDVTWKNSAKHDVKTKVNQAVYYANLDAPFGDTLGGTMTSKARSGSISSLRGSLRAISTSKCEFDNVFLLPERDCVYICVALKEELFRQVAGPRGKAEVEK